MADVLPGKHLPICSVLDEVCTADQTKDQSDLVPVCCQRGVGCSTAARTGSAGRWLPVQGQREPIRHSNVITWKTSNVCVFL